MDVLHVVGARPNFMKVAPVMAALKRRAGIRQTLVHTGQHYDRNMSDIFFEQLGIPRPDICLEVGSGTHATQTSQVMVRFDDVLQDKRPDVVLVYGDVNSTLAAALVCAKRATRIAHVEAGLRSFDRGMSEEINRLIVDQLADLLFTPSADADENLKREGIPTEKIHCVGNCMIDTLMRLLPKARTPDIDGLAERYALVTLHRPSNVDDPAKLNRILSALARISRKCQVVFPIHPRTRKQIAALDSAPCDSGDMLFLDPVGYLQFLALERDAEVVVTDSGGIQEETTFLGVPCLTLRENTERPVTVDIGTNTLVGTDTRRLVAEVDQILAGNRKTGQIPDLWDGRTGERIADLVVRQQSEVREVTKLAA